MGVGEKRILVALAVAMFLGTAVYLRIWTIDYAVSSDDAELLRDSFSAYDRPPTKVIYEKIGGSGTVRKRRLMWNQDLHTDTECQHYGAVIQAMNCVKNYVWRQFDLANREAMDESAEWRFKYDEEFDKAAKCMKELKQVKESLEKKMDNPDVNQKLEMLQKENMALVERVEALRQELEGEKMKCN